MCSTHESQKRALDSLGLELEKVMISQVGSSNWTWVPCKSNQLLLSVELSLRPWKCPFYPLPTLWFFPHEDLRTSESRHHLFLPISKVFNTSLLYTQGWLRSVCHQKVLQSLMQTAFQHQIRTQFCDLWAKRWDERIELWRRGRSRSQGRILLWWASSSPRSTVMLPLP